MSLTKNDYLIAGSLSGFVSRLCVQPLDVVKIRFQLQVEPIRDLKTSKYHGFVQAVKFINKEEGMNAFWKGHVPAQLQAVIFSGVQFLSFEIIASWFFRFHSSYKNEFTNYNGAIIAIGDFACGCAAGSLSAILTQPLDVLRTRFIAQGEPKFYHNMTQAAICMANREGIRGFFRGIVPSLLLISPQTGIQFAIYYGVNKFVADVRERFKPHPSGYKPMSTFEHRHSIVGSIGPIQSFIVGGIAGIGSKFAVYPLDMAKKRMQVCGFEEARARFGRVPQANSLRSCLMEIWRDEGALAMYKGLRVTLLKSFVSMSCRFATYEQICKLLLYYRNPKIVEV